MANHTIQVSIMIFTLNEEINLPLCLKSLVDFDDIIVVDSYSNDRTEDICLEYNARFFQNRFEGFGTQRNWALDNIQSKYPWILILDADERVTPDLCIELAQLSSMNLEQYGAFRVKRRFYMWGRWLKYSSLYPNWVVRLIHRDRIRYINRGHAETETVEGEVGVLEHDLIDENHKGMTEWLSRQVGYASKDAVFELEKGGRVFKITRLFSGNPLQRRDALKRLSWKLPGRPFIYFLYSYFVRLGFLDGWDGLMFCLMKSLYIRMVLIHKNDILRCKKMNPEFKNS